MEETLEIKDQKFIPGKFRARVGAYLLDTLIVFLFLGAIEYVLRLVFTPGDNHYFYLGGLFYWCYLSVFNSEKFSGASPGKRLMKLRVVDQDGKALSLSMSYFRYCAIALLFQVQTLLAWFSEDIVLTAWTFATAIYVHLAYFYLFFFNRTTKQLVHDLLVNSYVIPTENELPRISPRLPLLHKIPLALILAGVLGGTIFLIPKLKNKGTLMGDQINLAVLKDWHKELMRKKAVLDAGTQTSLFYLNGDGPRKRLILTFSISNQLEISDFKPSDHFKSLEMMHPEYFRSHEAVFTKVCQVRGFIFKTTYCLRDHHNLRAGDSSNDPQYPNEPEKESRQPQADVIPSQSLANSIKTSK